MQASKGEGADIVRVFLQTPTGSCHVDITRAILHSHLQVGAYTHNRIVLITILICTDMHLLQTYQLWSDDHQ